MRLGVVSDTHGHLQHALAGVRMLEALEVDAVVHCGDIGSAAVIELFAAWPTHFVFGNTDYDRAALELSARSAGQFWHGALGTLELGGRKIAFTHGDQAQLLSGAIADASTSLVCYGHTHRAEWHDEQGTRVLNPGALYRANPHTIAIVEIETLEVTIVPVG